PQRLAADSAYGSAPTLNWVVNEKKIAPHIPVIDNEDGTFSRGDFTFDKERNVYVCPMGKLLKTTGRILAEHKFRYIASTRDCGPRGAQDEFTLAATAQHLCRLAKLVARPPPLAAVCVVA